MPTLIDHPPVISLPGIDGSGPAHWQTRWETDDPSITRFLPTSWTHPTYADWAAALDEAALASPALPMVLAHSLATLLVARWAVESGRAVAGAVLVAVPDPASPAFPARAEGFTLSRAPLPCPTLVLASSDDPYGDLAHQRAAAAAWGATFLELGPLGHVNEASDLGAWDRGRELVTAFRAGLAR